MLQFYKDEKHPKLRFLVSRKSWFIYLLKQNKPFFHDKKKRRGFKRNNGCYIWVLMVILAIFLFASVLVRFLMKSTIEKNKLIARRAILSSLDYWKKSAKSYNR